MKIAQITWWRGNYGSILQAYAMQKLLEQYNDVDVEILDQFGNSVSANGLLYRLKVIGIKGVYKKLRWKFFSKDLRKRNYAQDKFVKANLRISPQQYDSYNINTANQYYDAFICGSDQIWNPNLSSLEDIYWLNFVDKSKVKIAYAPSIGITSVDKVQAEMIKRSLEGYQAISCREHSGTKCINNILGQNLCQTVLDPTLALGVGEWEKVIKEVKIEYKYIFTYMLRGTKQQRQMIEEYAKKKGLKIVTLPYLDAEHIVKYDKKFGDIKLYDIDPAEFIGLIKGATCVFTDSFHCSVFSIMFHKEFFLFPKLGQMERLKDIQDRFELPDRIITEDDTYETINNKKKIDWKYVDRSLIKQQKQSRDFLYSAISSID